MIRPRVRLGIVAAVVLVTIVGSAAAPAAALSGPADGASVQYELQDDGEMDDEDDMDDDEDMDGDGDGMDGDDDETDDGMDGDEDDGEMDDDDGMDDDMGDDDGMDDDDMDDGDEMEESEMDDDDDGLLGTVGLAVAGLAVVAGLGGVVAVRRFGGS